MTHRLFKYLTFFFFLLSIPVTYSQTISSINIKSNNTFDKAQYLEWLKIPIGSKVFTGLKDTVKQRMETGLTGNGYYNFLLNKISVKRKNDSLHTELFIDVTEGEPTYINKLIFENVKNDSLIINKYFKNTKGKIFDKYFIEAKINDLLNYYENNGYPFAIVKISSVKFFTDSLEPIHKADIYLTLKKNQLCRINKIEIVGNDKTKSGVILRNARININELYSEEVINKIPERLNRLRFFKAVDKPQYYLNSDNEGILQIKIEEKQTNNFDGIIGYVPSSSNSAKGYFTGFVNISLNNLFGTGRAAAIRWQQEDRNTQELELKYLEPWLFNYPLNLKLSLFQRKQDTTYVQRKLFGALEFLATETISASVLFSSESTIPSISDSLRFTVFNSTSFSSGLNLKIDTRNNINVPTSGVFFLNSYQFISKKIDGPKRFISADTKTDIQLQRLSLDFSFFYEIFNRQVTSIALHGKELRGDLFEISDLFKLGGTKSVRGYRERQFLGNRIFWSNLEYRYLLSADTYTFAFFDTGYYLRNEDKKKKLPAVSDFITSYGVGFSFGTSLGIFTVSYAIPEGAALNKGLIHFGIINDF